MMFMITLSNYKGDWREVLEKKTTQTERKEMEEILYMVMMFQKIVYGSLDLTEKVTIGIFKEALCKGEARSIGIMWWVIR
ncbi:hypothetical protein P8452_33172 [Trifolium repens]|nr:hypothetical protein P8452_33172 [Trifolium repens]